MRRVSVGLVFSRSGSSRLMPEACREAALCAITEVNADPERMIELLPLEREPARDADDYAPLCAEILEAGARHIMGCVTSWSSQEEIPTLEGLGGILWYSCPYEGFKASSQVVYADACSNQHLVPLLAWASPLWGMRSYLTGSNYVWGWEVNRVACNLLLKAGGEVVAGRHLAFSDEDVGRIIAEIRASRPGFVLNNLVGASSYACLRAMAGLVRDEPAFRFERCPVLSCKLTECEAPAIGGAAEGLVPVGPYSQDRAGADSSLEVAAYAAAHALAVRLELSSETPPAGLVHRPGRTLDIDPATHRSRLPVIIVQVENGIFVPREWWSEVEPDLYLAQRLPVVAARPQLVTP